MTACLNQRSSIGARLRSNGSSPACRHPAQADGWIFAPGTAVVSVQPRPAVAPPPWKLVRRPEDVVQSGALRQTSHIPCSTAPSLFAQGGSPPRFRGIGLFYPSRPAPAGSLDPCV